MSRSRRVVLVPVVAVAAAACSRAKVRDILERPGDFEGQTVSVAGTVAESTNLVFLRFYKIDDGTGRIAVVTKKAVPAKRDPGHRHGHGVTGLRPGQGSNDRSVRVRALAGGRPSERPREAVMRAFVSRLRIASERAR